MQWHTRLIMDPGAPGKVPLWGNSHFLFQGLITTSDKFSLLETCLEHVLLYYQKLHSPVNVHQTFFKLFPPQAKIFMAQVLKES